MPQNPEETKSLEMRIAAIEDKLSRMTVTEEEMRSYQKVSALMSSAGGSTVATPSATQTISYLCIFCYLCYPIIVHPPIIHPGINDCIVAPISQAGSSSTGFGTLGR